MSLPELTEAQFDAAYLVRAIEVLDRRQKSWLVRWYLKRLVKRLAR